MSEHFEPGLPEHDGRLHATTEQGDAHLEAAEDEPSVLVEQASSVLDKISSWAQESGSDNEKYGDPEGIVDQAVADLVEQTTDIASKTTPEDERLVVVAGVVHVSKEGEQPKTAKALGRIPEEGLVDGLLVSEKAGVNIPEVTEEIDKARLDSINEIDTLQTISTESSVDTPTEMTVEPSNESLVVNDSEKVKIRTSGNNEINYYVASDEARQRERQSISDGLNRSSVNEIFGENTEIGELLSDIDSLVLVENSDRVGTEIVDQSTGEIVRPIFNIELSQEVAQEVQEIVSMRRAGLDLLSEATELLPSALDVAQDIESVRSIEIGAIDIDNDLGRLVSVSETNGIEPRDNEGNFERTVLELELDEVIPPTEKAQRLVEISIDAMSDIQNELELRRTLADKMIQGLEITQSDMQYMVQRYIDAIGGLDGESVKDVPAHIMIQKVMRCDDLTSLHNKVKTTLSEQLFDSNSERFSISYQMSVLNPRFGDMGTTGSIADLYVGKQEADKYEELIANGRRITGLALRDVNLAERVLSLSYDMLPDGTYLNHGSRGASLEGILLNEGLATRSMVALSENDYTEGKLNGGLVHFTPHGTLASEYTSNMGGGDGGVVIMESVSAIMEKTPYRQLESEYTGNKFSMGGIEGSVQEPYVGVNFPDLNSLPVAFRKRFSKLQEVDEQGLQHVDIGQGRKHNLSFAASSDRESAARYSYEANGDMIIATNNLNTLARLIDENPDKRTVIDRVIATESLFSVRPPKFNPSDGIKVWMSSGARFVGFTERSLNNASQGSPDLENMSPQAIAMNYHKLIERGASPKDILNRLNQDPGSTRIDTNLLLDALNDNANREDVISAVSRDSQLLGGVWESSALDILRDNYGINESQLVNISVGMIKDDLVNADPVIRGMISRGDDHLNGVLVGVMEGNPDGLLAIDDAWNGVNAIRRSFGDDILPDVFTADKRKEVDEYRIARHNEIVNSQSNKLGTVNIIPEDILM